ncbi:DHA2 family efflux MFS transporter permease subunit [Deferribacterales bacterium Es71-Z0220]|uniref:DHA2 family efflux MFS transporter permease subunit n=1 Tax=Deferrivibrio essentukiensis TaxID=2880922 RepID=UPI001F6210C4|nr:DHA2 family efflux MFS transporter permease subunit [Deferrivibrio essentukiensis]MCB4203851.1 DHA2 family efflux MFS transporter permease subunit [Deferrivibrio essentukiensis]
MVIDNEKPIYEQISLIGRLLITFVVMAGTFMAILDTTIVDVVVPKMMAPLKTDLYGVQWVITSYMASAATALLLVESLDKVLGLSKLFIIGITIFTISSYLCGVSSDLTQMIVFRCMQGTGEAFVVASAQAILFSLYPPHMKGLAMGIYGMGVSFAPALGPTLGGWLTEHLGWRSVFFVNIPIGLMVVVLGLLLLPKYSKSTEKFKFNFISYFFLASFTISLLIMLSKGQQKGWFQSNFIFVLFFLSAISLIIYIIFELISKYKLIDFSIFKIPQYRYATLIYFFTLGLSIYQLFYLIPLYYENLRHFTTLQTGLHMLGFAIFIGLTSPIAGILSDKIGEHYVLLFNTVLYILTSVFLMPQLNYYTPSVQTILLTVPLGFSLGSFFAPITTLAMRHLKDKTSLGVGLLHYLRFMGGSFGTAIATNTLQSKYNLHFEEIGNMQNQSHVYYYFTTLKEQLSGLLSPDVIDLKMGVLLGKAMSVQALSNAFQDVFSHAGYFGIFGLSFLTFVFIHEIKAKKA